MRNSRRGLLLAVTLQSKNENDISPMKLEFEKEIERPCKDMLLDHSIQINDRAFTGTSLDKKDVFLI